MSINPVSAITSNDLASEPDLRIGPGRAPSPRRSDVEVRSNREMSAPPSELSSSEMPQDEVQVQRDPAGNGQIVIKYLDSKGNLILQVPNSQLLGMARAIEESFSAQAKAHAVNDAKEQGDSDGH